MKRNENIEARKIRFNGEDELLFSALHGGSTETLLPGTYRFNVGSLIHPEATLGAILSDHPSAARDPRTRTKMADGKTKPQAFARLNTAKIEASNLSTEIDLRLTLPSQDASD